VFRMRKLRTAVLLAIIGAVTLAAGVIDHSPDRRPPELLDKAPDAEGLLKRFNEPAWRVARAPQASQARPIDDGLPISGPSQLAESLRAVGADEYKVFSAVDPARWLASTEPTLAPDALYPPDWTPLQGLSSGTAWALLNNDEASFEQMAYSDWQVQQPDGLGRGTVSGNAVASPSALLLTQAADVPEPGTGTLWALGLLAGLLAHRLSAAATGLPLAGRG